MWIELGEIDYKIIIILIYPVLYHVKALFHKNDEKPIFSFFTKYLGYILNGIILLIIKSRMKSTKNNKNKDDIKGEKTIENSEQELSILEKSGTFQIITNIFKDNQILVKKKSLNKKLVRNQYLFILLLIIIYIIPMYLDSYLSSDNNFGTSSSLSLFFFICFVVIFTRIILGNKIYSHQIFSLIIILISILIPISFHLINIFKKINILSKNEKYNKTASQATLIKIILIVIVTCLFALFNTLEYKYFDKYLDTPYHLMFIMGLISTILILIYEIITFSIFGIDTSFNGIFYQFLKNCEKHEFLYILIFLGDIIVTFLWGSGIQLTIYFFTPCHFLISESISQILSTIINDTIVDFPIYEKVIIYIFFGVIIFATLIYNEVFIIKVCSLNKNTKKYIILRQLMDSKNLLKIEDLESEAKDE